MSLHFAFPGMMQKIIPMAGYQCGDHTPTTAKACVFCLKQNGYFVEKYWNSRSLLLPWSTRQKIS